MIAAVVCPAAPVLVPEVARSAAVELDGCRTACDAALAYLLAQRPERVVVVGVGTVTRTHPAGSLGSFRPIGVDLQVALGGRDRVSVDAAPGLPLSLTVGSWLLARHAWSGVASGLEVAAEAAPEVCQQAGRAVDERGRRTGLLVVADGSARRGPAAPGYTDPRAHALDRSWVDALAEGVPAGLAALDPDLCADLLMSGRAPLQVLAGAAGSRAWAGELGYADDPYGVQYAVATWRPAA